MWSRHASLLCSFLLGAPILAGLHVRLATALVSANIMPFDSMLLNALFFGTRAGPPTPQIPVLVAQAAARDYPGDSSCLVLRSSE